MFNIDIKNLKLAGSEKEISKTIEELLDLNNKIPKRRNKAFMETTESQLDGNNYENYSSRGEQNEVIERQFGERESDNYDIIEIELSEASSSNGGHRPEAWDMDEIEIRGHQNVPPIWHEVYNKEDERK